MCRQAKMFHDLFLMFFRLVMVARAGASSIPMSGTFFRGDLAMKTF